jgi:acyl carrier protein
MDKIECLRMFEETVLAPAGSITGAERLDQIEGWDSLSVGIFMVRADAELSVNLSDEDIKKCQTVNDLVGLLAGRKVQVE